MVDRREYLSCVHGKCSYNATAIQNSDFVGCFYCTSIFPAYEVKEFSKITPDIEEKDQTPVPTEGICPHCSVDSLLPDATQNLTEMLLIDLRAAYFSSAAVLSHKIKN
jgi:hypothetical protein